MIESTVFPTYSTTRNRQCSTHVSWMLYAYKIDYSLCIIDYHLSSTDIFCTCMYFLFSAFLFNNVLVVVNYRFLPRSTSGIS